MSAEFDKSGMRPLLLITPIAIGLLFWNSLFAAIFVGGVAAYYLVRLGISLWTKHRNRDVIEKMEPTIITQVLRAPHELLEVDTEAGTSTIMNSLFEKVKEERSDDLRLSKKGRRITAAKNELMARRRKSKQNDLQNLLVERPVFSGKLLQFKNLPETALKKYEVGKEIQGLGGISTEATHGRGCHRFVIHCLTGRRMNESGEAQVAFLLSTKFVVVSRERWQNPDDPNSPEGFSIELKEVA